MRTIHRSQATVYRPRQTIRRALAFFIVGGTSLASQTEAQSLETDPRFPSGPWTGFFLQKEFPGRHLMEIGLSFQSGQIRGEGRDWVGPFTIRGKYDLADGKCYWSKRYVGRHDLFYQGYNEGKGIWGVWEFTDSQMGMTQRGGFHIWPEGMADPTKPTLKEEADPPVFIDSSVDLSQPLTVGAGLDDGL
jgi:hypothetical protein